MAHASSCEDLRLKVLESCSSSRMAGTGFVVDTVSFQPHCGKGNEDRTISQQWNLCGHSWLLLAVLDGHGGSVTSTYAAAELPSRIYSSLSEVLIKDLSGVIEKGLRLSERVAFVLQKEIKLFDDSIGKVVKGVYSDARSMDEEGVKILVGKNQERLLRAHQGSTVSGVLIDMSLRDAWVFNLGDSTVASSHANEYQPGDVPHYTALTKLHHATSPEEYCLQVLEHPSKEDFIKDGYILGISEITRALGDHHFKLPAKYVRRVLSCLPPRAQFDYSGKCIKTPPYISSWADVGYVDLAKYEDVKLFLFTDGVDDIVKWLHRPPATPRTVKPAQIVAYLASTSVHAASLAGNELGHVVQPGANDVDGNRAVDILVGLLGGTDTQRLSRVLDPKWLRQLRDPDWDDTKHIYIDDTTLIVCQLTW